jgi:hypothetical protein
MFITPRHVYSLPPDMDRYAGQDADPNIEARVPALLMLFSPEDADPQVFGLELDPYIHEKKPPVRRECLTGGEGQSGAVF